MRITVIGHICLDTIHLPADETGSAQTVQSYGGIFFSVAGLATLADPSVQIQPVFGIGKRDYMPLLEQLSAYANVDPDGIYKIDGPTNEVHLFYDNAERRVECSKNLADPIPFKRIKPYLDTDMILINMVSGYDIALETLDEIRMAVRDNYTPIYFDVHSLTLGIGDVGNRFRRPLTDWRRWLFWLHAVQMNEEEAAGMPSERYSEGDFAKQVTALNTPLVFVTRGAQGCTVFWDQHKHISTHNFPGQSINRAIDATGCGDVFGAAYCSRYLTTRDILGSVDFANSAAALKATIAGSKEIERLKEALAPTEQGIPTQSNRKEKKEK